eukprot:403352886
MESYSSTKINVYKKNPLISRKGTPNYHTLQRILTLDNNNKFESCQNVHRNIDSQQFSKNLLFRYNDNKSQGIYPKAQSISENYHQSGSAQASYILNSGIGAGGSSSCSFQNEEANDKLEGSPIKQNGIQLGVSSQFNNKNIIEELGEDLRLVFQNSKISQDSQVPIKMPHGSFKSNNDSGSGRLTQVKSNVFQHQSTFSGIGESYQQQFSIHQEQTQKNKKDRSLSMEKIVEVSQMQELNSNEASQQHNFFNNNKQQFLSQEISQIDAPVSFDEPKKDVLILMNGNPFDCERHEDNSHVSDEQYNSSVNQFDQKTPIQRMDTPFFVNSKSAQQKQYFENGPIISLLNLNYSSDMNLGRDHRVRGESFSQGLEEKSLNEIKDQFRDKRKVFLTEPDILKGKKVFYSVIEENQQLIYNDSANPLPYKKTSQRRFTLVMDIVDIIIKIVDTSTEYFYLQDITIQEISLSKASHEILLIKYLTHPLIKALRDLQAYCELIVYTYLPKECISQILEKIPDLKNLFSFIFTMEDMKLSQDGNVYIKDVSQLLHSRLLEEIIIIEINQERVDQNYLSSVIVTPYDGSLNYTQLTMLKTTIKSLNGEQANSSTNLPGQASVNDYSLIEDNQLGTKKMDDIEYESNNNIYSSLSQQDQ